MAEFSKADLRYFERARQEASKSDYEPFKLGCVLVYHNHILSVGHNSNKSLPMQKHYNRYRSFRYGPKLVIHSRHAELDAIHSVPYEVDLNTDWKKVSVYIYRISNGKPFGFAMAAPCPACRKAMLDKGIKNLYYTGDGGSYLYERIL